MKKRDDDDETVMYILVNSDLQMGKGKTAAQCCHSTCGVIRILERHAKNDQNYRKWLNDGETKIVLRATEADMIKILDEYQVDRVVNRDSNEVWCVSTHDAGRTQIPAGSLTTIAFRPLQKNKKPEIIKTLKLLG